MLKPIRIDCHSIINIPVKTVLLLHSLEEIRNLLPDCLTARLKTNPVENQLPQFQNPVLYRIRYYRILLKGQPGKVLQLLWIPPDLAGLHAVKPFKCSGKRGCIVISVLYSNVYYLIRTGI